MSMVSATCAVGDSAPLRWPLTDPPVVSRTRHLMPWLWLLGKMCRRASLRRSGVCKEGVSC